MASRLTAVLLLLLAVDVAFAGKHHARQSFFKRRLADGSLSEEYPEQRPFLVKLSAAATLSVTPAGPLSTDVALVTVSWSGVSYPTTADWLGFYTPANSDSHDYLDYQYTNGKASGSMQFNVTNMRDSFEFRYIANNTAYVVVATSNVVSWVSGLPLQGRLSLGDSDRVIVSWNSDNSNFDAVVQFGTASGQYSSTASSPAASAHTYKASDMCNAPASTTSAQNYRNPGWFHDVTLPALTPNTRYYYRYGQNGVWSPERSFVTKPVAGAPANFIMYADQGATNCFRGEDSCTNTLGTVARVAADLTSSNNYTMVLHVGDIAYAVGFGYLWEMFGTDVEPVATAAPYLVSIGNHEYDHTGTGGNDPSGASGNGFHPSWGNYGDDSGGECGVPTYHRFKTPSNGNSVFWWSLVHGPVLVVAMSSEHDFTKGSTQYNWLAQQFAAADRGVTPWILLTTHRPIYSSENYQSDWKVAENMQTQLEPLLSQYKVDLVLGGHYHAYERTCPVLAQACCAAGTQCPTHIVAGMAGIGLDSAGWFKTTWSVFHEETHWGYLRLQATPTTLQVQFINDANGGVIDSLKLTK